MVQLTFCNTLTQSLLLLGLILHNPADAAAVTKKTSSSSSHSASSTTAAAKTSCSMVVQTPLPTNYYCDVQGRLKQPKGVMATFKGKNTNACLHHCLGATGCHAFALDMTANTCALYNSSMESQTFKASSSNVYFWNPKCFAQKCSSSSISSSSTASITTAPTASAANSVSGLSSSTTASLPQTTVVTPGPAPNCVLPLPLSVRDCQLIQEELSGARMSYQLYYNGTGVVENPVNPGNPNNTALPSFTVKIKGESTGCDAATLCAQAATSGGLASMYHSFDLHYSLSGCEWVCVAYGGYSNETKYFDVKDADAFRTHGFAGKMKVQGHSS